MKVIRFIIAAVFLCALSVSCSYSVGDHIGIDVTVSPSDGAVDVPLAGTVQAAFQYEIAEPATWIDSFTLRTGVAEATLCTEVTYDAEAKVATCAHDDLDPGTTYYIVISGITAVSGQETSFVTVFE